MILSVYLLLLLIVFKLGVSLFKAGNLLLQVRALARGKPVDRKIIAELHIHLLNLVHSALVLVNEHIFVELRQRLVLVDQLNNVLLIFYYHVILLRALRWRRKVTSEPGCVYN